MAALETQAIWDRIDRLQRDHAELRVDHTEVRVGIDSLTEIVKARALTADKQHAELLASIVTLTAAESERSGMAKFGRGAAMVIGSIAALVGIVAAALAWRPHG